MKSKLLLILLALTGVTVLHADKVSGGPRGGRLLDASPLKAEFFVNADRKVEVTFLDASFHPIAPDTQAVAVIAEPATGRLSLDMVRTATGFVAKGALPAGEPYRVVVQLRAISDAKPQNFRLDLNLATCGQCQHAEYACICEGH